MPIKKHVTPDGALFDPNLSGIPQPLDIDMKWTGFQITADDTLNVEFVAINSKTGKRVPKLDVKFTTLPTPQAAIPPEDELFPDGHPQAGQLMKPAGHDREAIPSTAQLMGMTVDGINVGETVARLTKAVYLIANGFEAITD